MLNTDNFTTFLPIFPFQIFSKYEKKARVLKVFSAAEIFFFETYAGVTQSANSWYFWIFLPSLIGSHIFAAISPLNESRKIQIEKQCRKFLTALKGTLCTRLIYLRLKSTDFWATYDGGRKFIINFYMIPVAGSFAGILLLRTCYSPWRRSLRLKTQWVSGINVFMVYLYNVSKKFITHYSLLVSHCSLLWIQTP